MNINKRIAYCDNETHIGIHTANGTTKKIVDLDKADKNIFVTDCNIRKVRNENQEETYLRVNPNKKYGGYIVDKYSDFQKVMQEVFVELGIEDFVWKRVDLSFNTMDNKYYENYSKLNRLLIACLANSSNDKNTYDTKNFWNGKTKSISTKNGYREAEFYDKEDESGGKSPYYSRLELRSMRVNNSIEHEYLDLWFERLDKAAQNFEKVQERYNQNLAELYLSDCKKKKHCREFLNLTSFLMSRRDCIFTSKQMKKLLIMIGLSKDEANNRAYYFKKVYGIEYFSKKDLNIIIGDIKNGITKYLKD